MNNLHATIVAAMLLLASAFSAHANQPPVDQQINAQKISASTQWINEQGNTVSNPLNIQSPYLVTMIYTKCTTMCSFILQNGKKVEKIFPSINLVALSLDHKEMPIDLSTTRTNHTLSKKWTLLSPKTQTDARVMANALGIRYQAKADGGIDHQSIWFLMSPKGHVLAQTQVQGLNVPPSFIQEVKRHVSSPAVSP